MFIVNQFYDYNGEDIYNKSCLIGIYESFENAVNDLKKKLDKNKTDYEIEIDYEKFYCYIRIETDSKYLCYEIYKKRIKLNEIKFK
jgi:hypothetical protein